MASIGSLNVDMNLNSAAFVENMKSAAASVASAGSQMKISLSEISSSFDSLILGAQGLIAALGIEKIASFATSAIDAAAEIGHLSEATGLSTDTIQQFQIAGEQAGISTDKMTSGLQRFASNLGAARLGSGALVSSLTLLNPELLNQLQHTTDNNAALTLYVNYLAALPDRSEAARLATVAFGRGMVDIAAIAKLVGGTLATALVMPPEVITGAMQLKTSMELLKTSITDGFTTGLVTAFAGSLKTTDDEIIITGKTAAAFGVVVGDAFNVGIQAAKALIDTLPDVKGWYEGAIDYMQKFQADAAKAGHAQPDADSYTESSNLPALNQQQMNVALAEGAKVASAFGISIQQLHDAEVALGLSMKDVASGDEDVNAKTAAWLKDVELTTSETNTMIAAIGKGPAALAMMKDQFAATDEVMKKFNTTATQGAQAAIAAVTAEKQSATTLADLQKGYAATESPLQKYQDTLKELPPLYAEGGQAAQIAAKMQEQAAIAMAVAYAQPLADIANSFSQLFAKNKAFGIASALISASIGIAKAFELSFPLNWEQAAAVAAACAVQIQKIESTSMGGGGSVTPASGSSASSTSTGTSATPGAQQAVSINLVGGSMFTRTQVEGLVANLKQYQTDGGTLLIK